MVPEEWPIAAASAEMNSSQPRAGGDRLSTVRADFFLPSSERLTEQERALMTAMLHCLVADIADEVRAALPDGAAAANDDGNLPLIDRLMRSRLLDSGGLVQLLLRRADEERVAAAATSRSGRREARVLQGLVSHSDGAVAAAAMALILARGRRRDRFGQCLLHFDDLGPGEAQLLVQRVCAVLRLDMSAMLRSSEADRLLAEAADNVLASHDPGNGIDSLTGKLVRLLDEEGGVTDDIIVAGALEGELTFVSHLIACRAGVTGARVFAELLSGDPRRVMVVLRAAEMPRPSAARLLAGIGDLLGIGDLGRAIDLFDSLDDGQVDDARTWLNAHPDYREAVAALGGKHG